MRTDRIADLVQPVWINGPEDPDLAPVWALAITKVETELGHSPGTRREWMAVAEVYYRLLQKARGSLARVVDVLKEKCLEIPDGD